MIIRVPIKMPKFKAITLGPVVLVFRGEDAKLIKHELAHVAQWKADPILFYPKYILEFIRNYWKYGNWMVAYRMISYEVEARKKSLE